MHFSSTMIVGLACLLQSGVYALPSGEVTAALPEANVTLVDSEEVMVDGRKALLESWLDNTIPVAESAGPSNLERRCGSNRQSCSNTNRSQTYYCQQLIDKMKQHGSRKVSLARSAVCLTVPGGEKCCTAWSKRTEGMVEGYLVNGAVDIFKRCSKGSLVSGSLDDVNIGGVCQKQCLSVKNYCR